MSNRNLTDGEFRTIVLLWEKFKAKNPGEKNRTKDFFQMIWEEAYDLGCKDTKEELNRKS